MTRRLRTVTPDDWGKTGKYRGAIRVLHSSSGFTMINKLPLESYLLGVVPLEVSSSWPAEALKAQACAARSYAERSRKPGEAFDVYCTTRDQAYGGMRAEAAGVERRRQGVRRGRARPTTASRSPRSSSRPRAATRRTSRTCGRPLADPLSQGRRRPLRHLSRRCTSGPRTRSCTATPGTRASSAPYGADNPTGVKGDLRTIYVLKRGTSPRVVKAAIVGTKGVTFVSGASLRYKLALRDTWVVLHEHVASSPGGTTVTYGVGTKLSGPHLPGAQGRRDRDAPLRP